MSRLQSPAILKQHPLSSNAPADFNSCGSTCREVVYLNISKGSCLNCDFQNGRLPDVSVYCLPAEKNVYLDVCAVLYEVFKTIAVLGLT